MITIIHNNKYDKELSFVTQQYPIGTYVIVDNNPKLQFGVDCKEEEYHKKLRIKAIKMGDDIISGSILTCRSKYPINKFKEDEKM